MVSVNVDNRNCLAFFYHSFFFAVSCQIYHHIKIRYITANMRIIYVRLHHKSLRLKCENAYSIKILKPGSNPYIYREATLYIYTCVAYA